MRVAAGWWGKKTPVKESSRGVRDGRGNKFAGRRGTPDRAAPSPRSGHAYTMDYLDRAHVDAGLDLGSYETTVQK